MSIARYLLLLLPGQLACTRAPPEFFLIPSLTREERNPSQCDPKITITHRSETYVVANPSSDLIELDKAIDLYNRRTLTNEELSHWHAFDRSFYEETWNTPRDYREPPDYDESATRLENQWQELLAQLTWNGNLATGTEQYFVDGKLAKLVILPASPQHPCGH